MKITISKDNKVSPLNLTRHGEKSSLIPCIKNPNSVHKLVLRSAPDITKEEMAAHIAYMQTIDNGNHEITYELTGVTHTVIMVNAPVVSERHKGWIEFTVEFQEV